MSVTKNGHLAFDIDGTLVIPAGNEAFLNYLVNTAKVACDTVLFQQTGNWLAATGLSIYQVGLHYACFQLSSLYQPPAPMPGAQSALLDLSGDFTLHVVTSRAKASAPVTRKELQRHFGPVFSSLALGCEGGKPEAVARTRAFLYVEDNPDQAQQVSRVATVVLFPSPYANGHFANPRVIIPQASRLVGNGMTEADWQYVYRAAWRELPHLIRDLRVRQNRASVLFSSP